MNTTQNTLPSTPESTSVSVATGVRLFQVPIACHDLEPMMRFFIDTLGFRIDAIYPSDKPQTAILSAHGISLRIYTGSSHSIETLDLLCDAPDQFAQGRRELLAPSGLVIRLLHADPPMQTPQVRQQLVIARAEEGAAWTVGRAGMRYRDLLPQRHGGAYIVSHIRILEGGPVPDYVHFHKIRFQMIFCRKGWVRLVYEGQGEPFLLNAGDCVLQPPMIRHRVLESSAGAEVVELASPSSHITMADHDMPLPNERYSPAHRFGGQRFVRHVASEASWQPWHVDGLEATDTGIGLATDGLAGVRVVRPVVSSGQIEHKPIAHSTEFCFFFILSGAVAFWHGDASYELRADDSIALPGDEYYALRQCSTDLEMLEVTLPATFEIMQAVE